MIFWVLFVYCYVFFGGGIEKKHVPGFLALLGTFEVFVV